MHMRYSAVAHFCYPGVNRLTNVFWHYVVLTLFFVKPSGVRTTLLAYVIPAQKPRHILSHFLKFSAIQFTNWNDGTLGYLLPRSLVAREDRRPFFSNPHVYLGAQPSALMRVSTGIRNDAWAFARDSGFGFLDSRDRTRLLWSYSSREHFNSRGSSKIRCESARHVSAFALRQLSLSAFIPSMLLCEYTSRLKNHPGISKSLNVRISKSLKISANIKSYCEIEKSVLK